VGAFFSNIVMFFIILPLRSHSTDMASRISRRLARRPKLSCHPNAGGMSGLCLRGNAGVAPRTGQEIETGPRVLCSHSAPGAKQFCALTTMTACCVTKKRCSKDVDIRCSLPPLPDKALRIAAICSVAAVVVDYRMPEMNGHEVTTEIKRLKPQIPIVMVSSDDAIPEPALNVVDAFLSKNEASRRLLPVITRICGENPSGFQETRITA
jgi:CheY-like chemotaxis protein